MKIFAQNLDTKFINSLPYCQYHNIVLGNVNNNLYQIHYKNQFDLYIFCSNLITREILQFISEFSNTTKFILYHTFEFNETNNLIELLKNTNCTHYGHYENNNLKVLPYMIHKHIFVENKDIAKTRDIITFLDYKYDALPESLQNKVYPKSKEKFQFFTNNFLHPQNLGGTTELEKALLLNSTNQYLSIDNKYYDYTFEAFACGSNIITWNGHEYESVSVDSALFNSAISYDEFIGDNL